MSKTRPRLHAALAVSVLVPACTAPAPEISYEPARRLVDILPWAESGSEATVIRFGEPSRTAHLVHGFSYAESHPQLGSYAWSSRPWSEISFWVAEPRPIVLRLDCRPLRFPGAPPQSVRLAVNGTEIAVLELSTDLASYRVEVPSGALVSGDNRLRFDYAWSRIIADVLAARDDRAVAVAFHELAFEEAPGGDREVRAVPERDLLFLPAGSRVTAAMPVPAGSELRLAAVRSRDGSGTRLTVAARTDEAWLGEVELVPGSPPPALPLAADEPAYAQIVLSTSLDGTGVWVEGAAIWRPVEAEAAAAAAGPTTGRRPHLIVYLVDTLRADDLGAYGGPPGLTPHLDRFAARATVLDGVAQSSWTRPSVVSLLTGVWPPRHGVIKKDHALPDDAEILPELLQLAGYATGGFVSNPGLAPYFGFDQGWDHYELFRGESTGEAIVAAAAGWIARAAAERPAFAYLHTVEPHNPYLAPQAYRARLAPMADELARQITEGPDRERWPPTDENKRRLRALYRAEVAYTDDLFGHFLDDLEELGLYDESVIVFTSDHGEAFYEHGRWSHGHDLYRPTLEVPMIVKLAGQREGARIEAPVQHTDLFVTLAGLAGVPPSAALDGRDLEPLLRDPSRAVAGAAFSHVHLYGPPHWSVIAGRWKLVRAWTGEEYAHELYDLRSDPGETCDLSGERPIVAAALAADLLATIAEAETRGLPSREIAIPEDLDRELRALGYVD